MSQLFGFKINKKEELRGQSPIPPNQDDAVATVAGGYFGTYVDTEAVAKNEYEYIKRYRDMAMHPECDSAVDEIVNEFVVIFYNCPFYVNFHYALPPFCIDFGKFCSAFFKEIMFPLTSNALPPCSSGISFMSSSSRISFADIIPFWRIEL